jgi:hypothetical protein
MVLVNGVEYHATVVNMVLSITALNLVKRSVKKRSGVVWSHPKKIPKNRNPDGSPRK